jgi:hypothetical protein
MRPYPHDPRTAEFVLDAEEKGVNKSNVGDIYKTTNPNYVVRFNDFQADEEFVRDQWGLWLTANAPIRDARNETIGAMGVDVSATEGIRRLKGLFWNGAVALGISLIAAYFLASLASRRIAGPRQRVHVRCGTQPLSVSNRAVKFPSKARRKAFAPIR